MYAILRTGGKQYKVETGKLLTIEKLEGNQGDKIEFNEILLVNNNGKIEVGQPIVSGAKVSAEIVGQEKGKKVLIFKKIRRHGRRLTKGHRQQLTKVKINEIVC